MIKWNVYYEDFNKREIKTFNIFDHLKVVEDIEEANKKYHQDKENFLECLRRTCMYHFWSKCEWEIILSGWPPVDNFKDEKISVYDQLNLNWDVFCNFVWENRSKIKVKNMKK